MHTQQSYLCIVSGAYDPDYHAEAEQAYTDALARLLALPAPPVLTHIHCIAPPVLTKPTASAPLPPPGETRALFDGLMLAAAEADRLDLTFGAIVILTDGRDDASLHRIDEAAEAVAFLKTRGLGVSYVGLSLDAAATAQQLGLSPDEEAKSLQKTAAGLIDLAAAIAPYFMV